MVSIPLFTESTEPISRRLTERPVDMGSRVDTGSTPTVGPVYRRLSERELLALLDGTDVPGLDEGDPVVQLLRIGLPTKLAQRAFTVARREGFLQLNLGYGLYPEPGVQRQLEEIWTIWCVVRSHPPITLTVLPDGEGRLACDWAPLERGWTDEQRAMIPPLLERARVRPGYGWRLTGTALEVAGLDAGDAVALARCLVWVATGGRFRGNRDDIGCA